MGSAPHLIDEWQEVPAIWDEVRHAIDDSGSVPGRFILTGSSRPKTATMEGEARGGVHHSGAGRIKRLRMWPMTLAERGISSGRVRLHDKVLQNPRARNAEPAFLAIVVGRGDLAYRRPDGVHVIPAATLTV